LFLLVIIFLWTQESNRVLRQLKAMRQSGKDKRNESDRTSKESNVQDVTNTLNFCRKGIIKIIDYLQISL